MKAGNARPGVRGARWAAWGLAAALLASLPGVGQAAERVALVIGNSAYHDPDAELRNPGNDADDMAAALERLGFEVVLGKDLGADSFYAKIDEFQEAAREADVTLFFYAGHGLQVEGENWLMPVDAKLEKKWHLQRRAVALGNVLDAMRGTKKLVFLDACRTNPLARGLARSMGLSRSEAANRGLARVRGVPGTLVVYATQADDVAWDGEGDNSPFTEALLAHIEKPGLNVFAMIAEVAESVFEATDTKQMPSIQSSPIGLGNFYLAPGAAPPPPDITTSVPTVEGTPPASGDAARAYEAAERAGTVAAYRAFIENFPGGYHAQLAQEQIDKLEEEPVVVAGGADPAPSSPEEVERRRTPGAKFRDCPDCPEMVVVPAGSFTMGSPSSEEDRSSNEGPQHRVTISRPFAVGVHEVTVGEFARFVSATGHSMGDSCWAFENGEWEIRSGFGWLDPGYGQTDGHPVVCVNWRDARAYVEWLSRETGAEYRLLSEAEWEYAARAGTATAYHTGRTISSGQANFDWNHGGTAPVGSFAANGFGLHDVIGNVWEWVEDCWNGSYAGAPGDGSAWQSGDCGTRIGRGGSWFEFPSFLRSAVRYWSDIGDRGNIVGFRVARTLAP